MWKKRSIRNIVNKSSFTTNGVKYLSSERVPLCRSIHRLSHEIVQRDRGTRIGTHIPPLMYSLTCIPRRPGYGLFTTSYLLFTVHYLHRNHPDTNRKPYPLPSRLPLFSGRSKDEMVRRPGNCEVERLKGTTKIGYTGGTVYESTVSSSSREFSRPTVEDSTTENLDESFTVIRPPFRRNRRRGM